LSNDGGWFFGCAIEKIGEKAKGAGGAEESHESDKNGAVHDMLSKIFFVR